MFCTNYLRKDKKDISFGIEQGVDFIYASFIRKAADIRSIREVLGEKGAYIKIFSKIENHEGVRKIDEAIIIGQNCTKLKGAKLHLLLLRNFWFYIHRQKIGAKMRAHFNISILFTLTIALIEGFG